MSHRVEQVQLTLYAHPVGQKRTQTIILNKKFQQHVLENKEQKPLAIKIIILLHISEYDTILRREKD